MSDIDVNRLIVKLSKKASISDVENSDMTFKGNNTFKNSPGVEHESSVMLKCKQYGYQRKVEIRDDILIESGIFIDICSITIPCYGVWNIFYRLNLLSNTGFSILKTHCVQIVSLDENNNVESIIINDSNMIPQSTFNEISIRGNEVYNVEEGKTTVKLRIKLEYGRKNLHCEIFLKALCEIYNNYSIKIVRIG